MLKFDIKFQKIMLIKLLFAINFSQHSPQCGFSGKKMLHKVKNKSKLIVILLINAVKKNNNSLYEISYPQPHYPLLCV